jgi:hypothetical protein
VCEPDEDDAPEPSSYKGTEQVVELFEAAVNAQVWFPTASAEEQARLRVAERSWVTAPAGWLFQCEISNVPPQTFLPLLAMFTQTHYTYEPLAEVRFTGPDSRTVDGDQLLLLRKALLEPPSSLPFSVDGERWEDAEALELTFEFADRLSQNRYEEFSEALNIWDHLRLLGGFELDFREAKTLPALGRTVWIGPRTAQHSLTDFGDDKAAMAALLNLVRWQHIRGMPLSSVTIE